jgi:hypothetical protein
LREYGLIAAGAASGIIWPLLLAQLSLSVFLGASRYAMRILANPRLPKPAFVVLGYLMLLAGLIIDTVAVF